MPTLRSVVLVGLASVAALLCAGCASTKVEATWLRPEFDDKPIQGPVMIVGLARDETVRRIYEDEMAARLGERGIATIRSHTLTGGRLGEDATERLLAAARGANARYLLTTALISREVEQTVTQEPTYTGGYRGWYGSRWGASYSGHTEVRTQNIYVIETSLTHVDDDRIEWNARTRTTPSSTVEKEARSFVGVVLGAMADAGLVGGAG